MYKICNVLKYSQKKIKNPKISFQQSKLTQLLMKIPKMQKYTLIDEIKNEEISPFSKCSEVFKHDSFVSRLKFNYSFYL